MMTLGLPILGGPGPSAKVHGRFGDEVKPALWVWQDKSSTAQALKVHGTEFKGRELRVTPCGKRNKGGKGSPKIHVKLGAERRIRAAGKAPQNGAKASYEGRRGTDVAKGDAKGIRLKKRAAPHGKGKKSKKKTPAGKAKRR
jgi:hypothetical protein